MGVFFVVVFSGDRVSLCSLACLRTQCVDQVGFEFRVLPASASKVLGIKNVLCGKLKFKCRWFFETSLGFRARAKTADRKSVV